MAAHAFARLHYEPATRRLRMLGAPGDALERLDRKIPAALEAK
jgi:hypothetical protein